MGEGIGEGLGSWWVGKDRGGGRRGCGAFFDVASGVTGSFAGIRVRVTCRSQQISVVDNSGTHLATLLEYGLHSPLVPG